MYDDVADIIDTLVAVYDNTDESGVHNATTRRARMLHYVQRTAEELWYHRVWPFTIGSAAIAMVAGVDTLPDDFARVSLEGGLYGPAGNKSPWVEISIQDMLYIRSRVVEQQQRLFAIDGVNVLIPNVGSADSFVLVYQKTAPVLTDGGQSGDPTGFPQPFGEALLLGSVMKLKQEEGDARQHWREDFQRALARCGSLYTKQSRVQRMPVTIGGMW